MLTQYVAEELKSDAVILKEIRKAREERQLKKPGAKGKDGDGK